MRSVSERPLAGVARLSFLACIASALQIAEYGLPSLFPGMKPGLANIITLVVLLRIGFREGLFVAAARTLLSSFILGTFLSPGFFLSISGAFSSAAVMGLVLIFNRKSALFSIMGISISGSLAHNFAQLAVMALLIGETRGPLWMVPLLGVSAVATGFLTGIVAAKTCNLLDRGVTLKKTSNGAAGENTSAPEPLHPRLAVNLPLPIKLFLFLAAAALVFASRNPLFHMSLVLILSLTLIFSGERLADLTSGIRRLPVLLLPLILFSFFFTPGEKVILSFGFLKMTPEGIKTGILWASRIVSLTFFASLVILSSETEELMLFLKRIFS
ncbi:MAG TPA: Gx transporter family protein, partial [bacterium]|nr:Gx transporter family protein [bacterium]